MVPEFRFGKDGDLTVKHSKQRDAILDDLQGRYDHPTAEMIFASIREKFPNISLGTVYRNLALLTEIGEIIKVGSAEDGKEHYDGHTHPHSHLFCEDCQEVYDLDFSPDLQSLEQALGIEIREVCTTLRGRCKECISKKTNTLVSDN